MGNDSSTPLRLADACLPAKASAKTPTFDQRWAAKTVHNIDALRALSSTSTFVAISLKSEPSATKVKSLGLAVLSSSQLLAGPSHADDVKAFADAWQLDVISYYAQEFYVQESKTLRPERYYKDRRDFYLYGEHRAIVSRDDIVSAVESKLRDVKNKCQGKLILVGFALPCIKWAFRTDFLVAEKYVDHVVDIQTSK